MKRKIASLLAVLMLVGLALYPQASLAQGDKKPGLGEVKASLSPLEEEGTYKLQAAFSLEGSPEDLKAGTTYRVQLGKNWDLAQKPEFSEGEETKVLFDLYGGETQLASLLYRKEAGEVDLVLKEGAQAYSKMDLAFDLVLKNQEDLEPKEGAGQEGAWLLLGDLDKLKDLKEGESYLLKGPQGQDQVKISKLPKDTQPSYQVKENKILLKEEGLEKRAPENPTPLPEESLSVKGQIKWVNDKVADRPTEVEVRLVDTASGQAMKSLKVSAKDQWAYSFTDLAKKGPDGKDRVYQVEEVQVPTGYRVTYEGQDIINEKQASVAPDRANIQGQIYWKNDTASQRPQSVKVRLVNKTTGQIVETREVTGQEGWKFNFRDVLLRENGQDYEYRVEEVQVPTGYRVSSQGKYDLVNTRQGTPVTPSKTGTTSSRWPTTRKSTSTTGKTSKNPKTLVPGYGLPLVGMGISAGLVVLAEKKRRKK